MKKNIVYTLLMLCVLSFVACSTKENRIPNEQNVLSINLSPNAEARAIIKDLNSKNVFFKWEVGNFDMNVVFKQKDFLKIVKGIEIKDAKGEFCSFDVTLPEGIDPQIPFDLYGIVAEQVKVRDGKILVGVGAHGLYELNNNSANRDGAVPVWFKSEGVSLKNTEVNATFEHLGAMAVVTIKNTSDKPLKTAGFAVRPIDGAPEFYQKGSHPFYGNDELPYVDLMNLDKAPENILTRVVYPSVDIQPGDVQYVGFWFRPNSETTPAVNLVAYNAETRQPIVSTNTRSERPTAMHAGRAYNIYATWDGTNLVMQDQPIEKELPAEQPKIIFTTNQEIGEMIPLVIGAASPQAERDVWIDLNDNQKRDAGEYVTDFANEMSAKNAHKYKLGAKKITIYGDVVDFAFIGIANKEGMYDTEKGLTSIDVSENNLLDQLFVYGSKLGSVDLTANTKLRRVGFEHCGINTFKMPETAEGLQELYLTGNNLTTIDISAATNVLGFSLSENKLTQVTYPRFTTLWIADIYSNQLSAAALNQLYNSLQKAGQKYAEWFYTIEVYDNPGVAGANHAAAKAKGWTVITGNQNASEANTSSISMGQQRMSRPLKNYVK